MSRQHVFLVAAAILGSGPIQAQGLGLGRPGAYSSGMGGPMNFLSIAPSSGFTSPSYSGYSRFDNYGFGPYSGLYGYPTSTYYWGYPYDERPRYSLGHYLPASVVRQPDNRATIRLQAPTADAEVWFDCEKTSQTGTIRDYYSPPLTPGKSYVYRIRVRWLENGKPVEKERTIHVRANTRQDVDFAKTAARAGTP
jgi:uncharacterized protein (TIGR03000 family)